MFLTPVVMTPTGPHNDPHWVPNDTRWVHNAHHHWIHDDPPPIGMTVTSIGSTMITIGITPELGPQRPSVGPLLGLPPMRNSGRPLFHINTSSEIYITNI